MDFLEKDLEQIIWDSWNEDKGETLSNRGLEMFHNRLFRQLKIGNYGIADLVGVSRYPRGLHITIYELKKETIGISAFLQAVGYARGIQRYLEYRGFKYNIYINIVLIGKHIDTKSTFCYLPDIINVDKFELSNYTYFYSIDGVYFETHLGFKIKNEKWLSKDIMKNNF